MQLYSSNDNTNRVDLKEAVLKSLAKDKGLYMPMKIPQLSIEFIQNLENYTLPEIAFQVSNALFENYIPSADLWKICEQAINFPAPVVQLDEQLSALELFHGPSLAFKDFGARYMSQLMSYLTKDQDQKLTILVATSGDTGGAVAAGFYDTPGIEVIILYPSGRVSDLQEKQLTTLGKNIYACEVKGSFDDCQSLVKQAFLDDDLNEKYSLSSANSINIARLIPQSFYYFEAFKQLDKTKDNVFCVPSGNFGNLTAGVLAYKMGLPIHAFIAATNANNVVPRYLESGSYDPMESIATISNAMDVGAPSNFVRLQGLFGKEIAEMRSMIKGYYYSDDQTRVALSDIYNKYDYVADPHGAVGFLAAKEYLSTQGKSAQVTVLETAHPSKFKDVVEEVLSESITIPERLDRLKNDKKVAHGMSSDWEVFKAYLMDRTT